MSTTKTLCDNCIHDTVCGEEGHLDPAMTFCAYQVSEDVAGFVGRTNGLLLVTITQYLGDPYFTVIESTGEVGSQDTYRHPENYRVTDIRYSLEEMQLQITVEPINHA